MPFWMEKSFAWIRRALRNSETYCFDKVSRATTRSISCSAMVKTCATCPWQSVKHRLHAQLRSNGERLLYCDHIEGMGEDLFHLACRRDLEGVVAKRKYDPYLPSASWLKIRNRNYGWAEKSCLSGKSIRNQSRDGIPAQWLPLV
jgi:hypothetical protein